MKIILSGTHIKHWGIFLLLFFAFNASAQKVKTSMQVHKAGALIFEKDVQEIDSVKFYRPGQKNAGNTQPNEEMVIYVDGTNQFSNNVSEIDSVTFLKTTIYFPLEVTGTIDPSDIKGCPDKSVPAAATTVQQLESLPGTLVIKEGCKGKANLTVSSMDQKSGTCTATINRTYTIKDSCDNTFTVVHQIKIQDTAPPTISGALDPVNINGCPSASIPLPVSSVIALEKLPGTLSISDACTQKSLLSVSSVDGYTSSCPMTINRTYTIKDACGNSASLVQQITIQDNTPPMVVGTLSNLTVQGCSKVNVPKPAFTVEALEQLPGSISVNDECAEKEMLVVDPSDSYSGTCPMLLTRTYTIKDGCNNSVKIVQLITFESTP